MSWSEFETSGGAIGGWQRGDGDTLAVVLHGGPGMTDYTEDLADEVAAGMGAGSRVVRYQQRGFAPSHLEGPFTVAQGVDDLFAVLDRFEREQALLVGHSWGGHLAMHAACARPERVSGLVLVDTFGAVGDGGVGTMEAVIEARMSPDAIRRYAELEASDRSIETESEMMAIIWPGYFSDPAAAPPAPATMLCSPDVYEAVAGDAVRLLKESVLEQAIPRLSIPSVHLIGGASPINPEVVRATAALFRDAIVQEFDGVGHFIWIERPGSVERAVALLMAQ
jgi:proline iminopeptidase